MTRKNDRAADRRPRPPQPEGPARPDRQARPANPRALNKRAALAGEIGKVKADRAARSSPAAREEEVLNNVLAANKGPLARGHPPGHLPRTHQRLAGPAEESEDRLPRAGVQLQPPRGPGPVRRGGRVHPHGHHRGGVRGSASASTPTTASCRWRTRPTAASPTRSTCSSACRRSRSAPRSACGCITTCWPTASRRRSAASTARPQALSQCRNWLSKNVPHATLHEVSSTADAAKLAQTEPNAAAVASRQAAVQYGLNILCPQHRGLAVQRDAVRRHRPGRQRQDRQRQDGDDVPDQPHARGAGRRPGVFKQNKINLTWIESFPYREAKGEYVFFLDFDGHRDDPKVKKTLAAMEEICDAVLVLGSFPFARQGKDSTELVSVASYQVWGEDIAHVAIATNPARRGRGFGKAAVALAAQRALEAGLIPQYRTLSANTSSLAIARHLGFIEYGFSVAVRLRTPPRSASL